MKRIQLTTKPVNHQAKEADAWVSSRKPVEGTKRLNVDLPISLHQAIKVRCAQQGRTVAELVRELLEGHQLGQLEGQGLARLLQSDSLAELER